ncbi:probable leucine-rich repeat receptor-like protein kinase At1g35710 [Vigna radiata var. radiata]|uniref:Probable leucine-rich repeat receptor-like protein kinase At1g35710 n=1 Tax=Vigna radiata var. radiata TaxID=3916 RepID=A0A3Q0F345_VIGRR|nr:probable leucine-rich repeat receptor-like protein kinase At1g35710 [Vigna radiata var. radiata]
MIAPTTTSMKNPVGFLRLMMMFVLCVVSEVINGEEEIRCIPEEREALLQFKAAIVDHNGMLSSWTTPNYCQWEGIRCSNLTSHIISLDLHGDGDERYMSGEIHKSLMELSQLQYLNLSHNYFPDTHIPEFLASLKNLKYLDLSSSQFEGKIPTQLGSLSHLKYLNLADNYLEGAIPYQFGNLSQLQHLELSDNLLEGNIPSQLGNLSQLHQLYLQHLYNLKISDGGQWLSNLISLTHLYLDSLSNLNHSHIWSQVIAKLPQLRELSLVDCSLSDHFILSSKHSKFNFSTSLSVFDLSGNTFTSAVIFQWVSNITSNLVHLDLSDNNLTEDLPSILGNLSRGCVRHSLQELDLSANYITGTLSDISVFSSLKSLFLGANELSGRIPEGVKLPSTLEDLLVWSNSLEGGIPKSFGNACFLLSLDISNNSLSDELPMIISHLSGCARYSLQVLYLHDNQINGTLPDFSTFTSLGKLYLHNNKLNGEIHKDIQFPPKLEDLYIYSNSLKGVLTDYHFANMSMLQNLDLSDNSLGLAFTQNWVPHFQLLFINLRSCQLGPTFPMWLQTQNKFVDIDISNATISGIIPEWFWAKLSLQRVMTMNISYNSLQGLSLLKVIDLSSNHFSEEIPTEIEKLAGLISLNLSRNNLIGKIPSNIGNMTSLESLDLSRNRLVGSIPLSLAQIYGLGVLDLSQNHLSGKIPTSTQLQSFHQSSYEDNLDLCGPPLEKLCIDGKPTQNPNANVYKDEYPFFNNEFFISMGIGFALSFWTVIGSILFKRSWQRSYFNFLNNLEDNVHVKIAIFVRVINRDKD